MLILLIMKKLRVLMLALAILLARETGVVAQELTYNPTDPIQFQNYSYEVKDSGEAAVWMRVENVVIPLAGGEYKITLPDNHKGEPSTWYKENGCQRYSGENCLEYGTNNWKQAEHKLIGSELVVIIPKRTVLKLQDDQPISLGIAWMMGDITTKKWWGREVAIESAKSNEIVSTLSIGVNFPEGVSYRDKQAAPSGWGKMVTEIFNVDSAMNGQSPKTSDYAMPYAFEYVGGGVISRYANNLLPGEAYRFKVMTSASIWKLYTKEIVSGVVWILAIAIVLALLLFMVIGRKSLLWYGAVILLLGTLLILIFGLILSYNFTFGKGGGDTFPMYSEARSVIEPGLEPESLPVEMMAK